MYTGGIVHHNKQCPNIAHDINYCNEGSHCFLLILLIMPYEWEV